MTSTWQYVSLALGSLVLILGLGLWYTGGQLSDSRKDMAVLQAEYEILKITSSGLRDSIATQNDKLKAQAGRRLEADEEVIKATTKIETRYVARYELVKDLNASEECEVIKRIIDEDFNRTIN